MEMAALELRASRLVRARDAATGQRAGFGEQGASSVVSARYSDSYFALSRQHVASASPAGMLTSAFMQHLHDTLTCQQHRGYT